ncbi:FUSC family protein [Brachybacterium kimchii]|uniref:FUSC family protein n=1 Tax=Brachybacterium kimchii TaxID=2942909 RepID=A0ABY4N7A3_9MICO|nr:FUSC family protein [Brachybacterium kimchii]UQN30438.1 FUSC family protein [Brachybacterium kimchii]
MAVTLPLGILMAADRTDLIPYAVFAAMGSVYGKQAALLPRLLTQSVVGVAMVISIALGVIGSIRGAETPLALAAIAVVSLLGIAVTSVTGWRPVPSLFLVFSTGTIAALPHTWSDLSVAVLVASSSATLALLIGLAIALVQDSTALTTRCLLDPRDTIGTASRGRLVALYTIAPPLAGAIALGLHLGHPFWAAVSATVPLAGITFRHQLVRTGHRMGGTILGVTVAYAFLWLEPPGWALVIVVALCQFATELFVARNYGIAVFFITPMALILTETGSHAAPGPLIFDRILETALGVAVTTALLAALHLVPRQRGRDKGRRTSLTKASA